MLNKEFEKTKIPTNSKTFVANNGRVIAVKANTCAQYDESRKYCDNNIISVGAMRIYYLMQRATSLRARRSDTY